jgi:hypothetical protein
VSQGRCDSKNFTIPIFELCTATVRFALDTYAVSEPDRTLNIHVVGSSFPNWNGTDQKRSFVVSADELKLTNPVASTGGITEVVWKRAK